MSRPLKVGRIPYLNLVPIFRCLEEIIEPGFCEFVVGVPSTLNRMLREGTIDISPSSSIQYLREADRFVYIDGHSISARGPVQSILLFSRVPLEELDEHEIFLTSQSETSVGLLRIIFERFLNKSATFTVTAQPLCVAMQEHSAYLAIGDEALRTLFDASIVSSEGMYRICSIDHQLFYIYDLSELWYRYTGLPMVFALWTASHEVMRERQMQIEEFSRMLDHARDRAVASLEKLSREPGLPVTPEQAYDYWTSIIFGLPDDCKQGLQLFGRYIAQSSSTDPA